MRTNAHKNVLAKLLATTALAMIITGAPATMDFDSAAGVFAIKPSLALAKGGSDDGGSDSSGSGSDSSGSGSGHDSDNSGSGSDDDDGDDDDGDNSGENQADDDEPGETEITLADGTRVEVSGDNIEVVFADGSKEEIEDGRFESKDPSGNTVEERPATVDDRAHLESFLP